MRFAYDEAVKMSDRLLSIKCDNVTKIRAMRQMDHGYAVYNRGRLSLSEVGSQRMFIFEGVLGIFDAEIHFLDDEESELIDIITQADEWMTLKGRHETEWRDLSVQFMKDLERDIVDIANKERHLQSFIARAVKDAFGEGMLQKARDVRDVLELS